MFNAGKTIPTAKQTVSKVGMMPKSPHVFVSYSHDSDAHKQWVRRLAEDLTRNGVETTLDQVVDVRTRLRVPWGAIL